MAKYCFTFEKKISLLEIETTFHFENYAKSFMQLEMKFTYLLDGLTSKRIANWKSMTILFFTSKIQCKHMLVMCYFISTISYYEFCWTTAIFFTITIWSIGPINSILIQSQLCEINCSPFTKFNVNHHLIN